jgi:penicillin-binding protein 1A
MNRIFLGGGIYGVETMSEKLLRKPASSLTLGEAALIAGIIRNPAGYSPWNHFDAARQRSFVVLQRMREEGKITPAQEQFARNETIRIAPQPSVSATSTAATTRPTGRFTPHSCRRSRTRPKLP